MKIKTSDLATGFSIRKDDGPTIHVYVDGDGDLIIEDVDNDTRIILRPWAFEAFRRGVARLQRGITC